MASGSGEGVMRAFLRRTIVDSDMIKRLDC
jgi:hypothetical protein